MKRILYPATQWYEATFEDEYVSQSDSHKTLQGAYQSIFENMLYCIANNVKPIKYEIEFCDFPGEHENDTKIVQTKVTPITSYTFKKSIVKAIETS